MRLDLPAQTKAIDRRDPQETPLLPGKKIVADGTPTVIMVRPAPDRGYGPEPGDPPAALNLDGRGWYCQAGVCMWRGLI
ncbi:hypothetical protein [Streptomyces hokutonensis]|uniref:hypothetical protein n=1 Tax=Streptomyces hokutonensis TaxID=1306990 RepID=UPI000363085B|nr:hypothetical protein [Streptomyces hokutonensis]